MHPLFSRWATEAEGFMKVENETLHSEYVQVLILMHQLTPLQSAGPQVADQSMEHPHNKYLTVYLFSQFYFPPFNVPHNRNPWQPVSMSALFEALTR
jgi:hypothetical protein